MELKELTEEPPEFADVPNIHVRTMVHAREFRLEKNVTLFDVLKPHAELPVLAGHVARTRAAIEELHRDLDNILDVQDWRLRHEKMSFDEALQSVDSDELIEWIKVTELKNVMSALPEHEVAIEKLQRLIDRIGMIRTLLHTHVGVEAVHNIGVLEKAEVAVRDELKKMREKLRLIENEIDHRQNARTAEFPIVTSEDGESDGANI